MSPCATGCPLGAPGQRGYSHEIWAGFGDFWIFVFWIFTSQAPPPTETLSRPSHPLVDVVHFDYGCLRAVVMHFECPHVGSWGSRGTPQRQKATGNRRGRLQVTRGTGREVGSHLGIDKGGRHKPSVGARTLR